MSMYSPLKRGKHNLSSHISNLFSYIGFFQEVLKYHPFIQLGLILLLKENVPFFTH